MEPTGWASTALLGPDQCLYWRSPHPFTGHHWGRGTYGWAVGTQPSWTTSTCCCPFTWRPSCTIEALNNRTNASEPQTEGQSSPQSTCKTLSPYRQIETPFLEPIVNLDFRRQTETSYSEGGWEIPIFVASDLDQDGQIWRWRSFYVEQNQRQTWLTTGDVQTGKRRPAATFYHFQYSTSCVSIFLVVKILLNFQPLCHHCLTHFGMVDRLEPSHSIIYTPLAFYYVSTHSPGPILPAASYGQRQHLSYPTITLSDQGTFFRHGFFTFSTPTRLDTSAYYTPSTGHFTAGPETYAATGSQEPVLQHPGPQGRGQPLHWNIWQPVPDLQGDLPRLRPQSLRFGPQISGDGYALTEMVNTPTIDGLLYDDRHGSRSSDAWWPPSFSPGYPELVLPVMEDSSTSRCLHVTWLFTFVADTPSRSARYGLCGLCSSDSSRASIRHCHTIYEDCRVTGL